MLAVSALPFIDHSVPGGAFKFLGPTAIQALSRYRLAASSDHLMEPLWTRQGHVRCRLAPAAPTLPDSHGKVTLWWTLAMLAGAAFPAPSPSNTAIKSTGSSPAKRAAGFLSSWHVVSLETDLNLSQPRSWLLHMCTEWLQLDHPAPQLLPCLTEVTPSQSRPRLNLSLQESSHGST